MIVADANLDERFITDMQGRAMTRIRGRAVDVSMLEGGTSLVRPLQLSGGDGSPGKLIKV